MCDFSIINYSVNKTKTGTYAGLYEIKVNITPTAGSTGVTSVAREVSLYWKVGSIPTEPDVPPAKEGLASSQDEVGDAGAGGSTVKNTEDQKPKFQVKIPFTNKQIYMTGSTLTGETKAPSGEIPISTSVSGPGAITSGSAETSLEVNPFGSGQLTPGA